MLLNHLPLKVTGTTECIHVIGRLRCPTNPLKAGSVRIDLVDEDFSGCGADFGPFNTPDPYLRIEHACPHQDGSQTHVTELNLVPIFLPRIVNLGFIYLDRYQDDTV
ncbi:unnamed protein product [Angiostrongylus costaricensis]|uniref:Transthyretin-like family protein n=1 Tax=Angiostrongylus costaricensis TaxID=334426 RepID=A0A0R3PU59_ANGCS|nr:unnamed protein product [Angiostrongylus costaricensis]